MYRTRSALSSRGDNLGISEPMNYYDLKVSDILVPSYVNEETRRQGLKENLNKMWQKSLQKGEPGTSPALNNNAQYVSKTAALHENRSRRRNLATINYLETLKRRQIMGQKKDPEAHNEYFKTNFAETKLSRRAITAQPMYTTPLNYIPRSQNTRVLIDKMLPSSRAYKRQELLKNALNKRRQDYEFAEIEDSIKDILKKGEKRPQTSFISAHFDRPVYVASSTSTGTSMFDQSPEPHRLLGKKSVQKRHKFIQSSSVATANSGSQTEPFQPAVSVVIKEVIREVERKQTPKVDVVIQTKPIRQQPAEVAKVPEVAAEPIPIEIVTDTIMDTRKATATTVDEDLEARLSIVKIVEETNDNGEKKAKKPDTGRRMSVNLPRLGPNTPADAVSSRPGTRGFKSNFSDTLNRKNTTTDLTDAPSEQEVPQNVVVPKEQKVAEAPVVKSKNLRPKSSPVSKKELTKAPSPVEYVENDEDEAENYDEENDEIQEEEESAPPVIRARTAPADIAPPKSILKKRPQFNRQISYNSDGTGTPGYAKAYHKTKDFHIDPTLFRHFGEANTTRRLSFVGLPNNTSTKSTKKTAPVKEVTYEEEEPQNINYYDQQNQYEEQTPQRVYPNYTYQQQFDYYQPQSQPFYQDSYPLNNQAPGYQYNYNYGGYFDPYLQQSQYQQIPNYGYSYPATQAANPFPYYATNSDSQLMNNQGYYEQQNYNFPQVAQLPKPTKSKPKKSTNATTTFKPNINMQRKERIPVVKTFYVPPKKPPTPQYIPLSQTQPQDIIQQEPLFRPKPKLRSHVSDTTIRVHAKDTLSRNPRGKLRQLYATAAASGSNDMERLANDEPLY